MIRNQNSFRFLILNVALLSCQATNVMAQNPDDLPPPIDHTAMDLAGYRAAADALLPTWGITILGPTSGPDWMATLSSAQVATAAGDTLPTGAGTIVSGPLTEARDAAHRKVVKIDKELGRVRYINLDRQFNWLSSPHVAVSESMAQSLVLAAASQLSLPSAEYLSGGVCTTCSVARVVGKDFLGTDTSGNEFSSHEAERMVTFERQVNGLPVLASSMRASVSNNGEIARMLVHWPRFRLLNNGALTLRVRDDVLDDIAAQIWDLEAGSALDQFTIELAYARLGSNYVPVANVVFIDRDSGSGFVVPLVDLAADADFDGTADAVDNCPTFPNIAHEVPIDCNMDGDFNDFGEAVGQQCDRDGDGIGDPCDNCPDNANATQVDQNNNGIGDACEVPQGACLLAGGECDTIPQAHCTAEGGLYQGDGTACIGIVCIVCQLHGDVYPIGPPTGNCAVNLDDILCTLAAFANPTNCPTADIAPCGGDGIYNLDDVLSVLSAFAGTYACQHPCPQ